LMERDGEDLRNRPFLDRKNALARLFARHQSWQPPQRTRRRSWPDCFRSSLPAWRRGHRLQARGRHVSIRTLPGVDQGPKSREHRGAAGAQRELEQVIFGTGRPSKLSLAPSAGGCGGCAGVSDGLITSPESASAT
jgi:hypothetical protein